MNFGHKLSIVIVMFVVFILTLVVLCMRQDNISLVSPDYYKKEIAYSEELQKHRETKSLGDSFKIKQEANSILIQFPSTQPNAMGEITLYRPSDSRLDQKIPIKLDQNQSQIIETNNLKKGLWIIKMEWESGGKKFIKEQNIIV